MKTTMGIFPIFYVEENSIFDIGGPFIVKDAIDPNGIYESTHIENAKHFYIYFTGLFVLTLLVYFVTTQALLIPLIGVFVWHLPFFQYHKDVIQMVKFGKSLQERFDIGKDSAVSAIVDFMNHYYPKRTNVKFLVEKYWN